LSLYIFGFSLEIFKRDWLRDICSGVSSKLVVLAIASRRGGLENCRFLHFGFAFGRNDEVVVV